MMSRTGRRDKFLYGERFHKTPGKSSPLDGTRPPKNRHQGEHVLYIPLKEVNSPEIPVDIVFVADALQFPG